MAVLNSLLQGIVENPQDAGRWQVLADWLEEHDDPRRAELLRLHRRLLATSCEPDEHPERAAWQGRVIDLLGEGVMPCGPRRTVLVGRRQKVPMEFVWVPPGSFLMGSPEGEEGRDHSPGFEVDETRHPVTLTCGFWLGARPVTRLQWRRVRGGEPRSFRGRDEFPVTEVSWEDCQQLGEQFRLPTEAEWEMACRAGTATPFFFGQAVSGDQANAPQDYTFGRRGKRVRGRATPVGAYPPNAWGLYDMHGGVWEGLSPGRLFLT